LAAMLAIVDTGPIVAFFDRAERYHHWAVEHIEQLQAPLPVCEPVLVEAMFLLQEHSRVQDTLLEFVQDGEFSIAFRVDDHIRPLRDMMRKYRDVPMSLADACLVCMAEIHEGHAVLTLDSDFSIYRKHGRRPLTLIQPTAG
jgi:uncharacterized protein